MPRKKIEVVELNKKEEKILLAEEPSALILFFRHHRLLIFLTGLILALTILGVSLFITIRNINESSQPHIKQTSVDMSLDNLNINISNYSITEKTAVDTFSKNGLFPRYGEVLLVKKVEHDNFTIKYYSDGTALKIMKDGSKATRITALENGNYGINIIWIYYLFSSSNYYTRISICIWFI